MSRPIPEGGPWCWFCVENTVTEAGDECGRCLDVQLKRARRWQADRSTTTTDRTHARYRADIDAADWNISGVVRSHAGPDQMRSTGRESWDGLWSRPHEPTSQAQHHNDLEAEADRILREADSPP